MFCYSCDGDFVQDVPAASSLGLGMAPFRLLRKDDLPACWRPIPVNSIGIELPDTPWGRAYFAWATGELRRIEDDPDNAGYPGVMLVSMANFREPGAPKTAAAQCLRSLLAEGRPPKEHVFQLLQRS